MIAFSINKGISHKLSMLVYNILNKNEGMVRRAVGAEVKGYIDNRRGIINEKVDTIKEEVWHKVINGFNEQKIVPGITVEEGIERYTKRTLSTYLKDIATKKQKESDVDIDVLDGRNRDNGEDYGNKGDIYKMFHSVINDQISRDGMEHGIVYEEFIKFIAELYLTNMKVYKFCKECIISYNNNSIIKRDEAKKCAGKFNAEENKLFERFKEYIKSFTTIEVEQAFKSVEKMKKTCDLIDKEKEINIEYYNISEFLKEGGILSCAIQGEYSKTYFDLYTCSMRGEKRSTKGLVDLKTSICRISNQLNGKKVFKIRIEDYLQYANDNTDLYIENIETELLKWCGKYYIYILPSGMRFGFCRAHNEYMVNVKLELLANLVHKILDSKSIIAMDEEYIYFCPNSKPRMSSINVKLFNGKTVKMKISEAENFIMDASVAI